MTLAASRSCSFHKQEQLPDYSSDSIGVTDVTFNGTEVEVQSLTTSPPITFQYQTSELQAKLTLVHLLRRGSGAVRVGVKNCCLPKRLATTTVIFVRFVI